MIHIGALSFSSQAKAKDYVRELLVRLGEGEVVPGAPEFSFLSALVERHPEREEKTGSGIARFLIRRNTLNRRALELAIVRLDGTAVDISWHTAIKGTHTDPAKLLANAMRSEIAGQIAAFEKVEATSCTLCRQPLEGPLHVDHILPFKQLARDFLATVTSIPLKFGDGPHNGAAFLPEDEAFACQWNDYHKRYAQLRLVHARCNLTRRK